MVDYIFAFMIVIVWDASCNTREAINERKNGRGSSRTNWLDVVDAIAVV